MRKLISLILVLIIFALPTAFACEEHEGGKAWETGDMLAVTNCKEWVSLRKTASAKAERLAKVPLGKSVYYLSDAGNGFSHVYYDGEYGYIRSDYLTYDGISVRFVTGCNEWISLRESASTKARRLEKIPLGDMVYYTDLENNSRFAWVNYANEGGYALEQYLSLTPYEKGDWLAVTNCEEYVTLRMDPSVNGEAVKKLPLGTEVQMIGAGRNGFIAVRHGLDIGYVLAGYLGEPAPQMLVWGR